ncbi:MAG: flippase [Candidatus Rifleibacteriota bacterium]
MSIFQNIIQKFQKAELYRKVSYNVFWLLFDKFFRLGVGLIIGVWIARYLGPDLFGRLNYAIAFSAIFGSMASLGLDSIIVRELVKTPEERGSILGTSFLLKLFAGLVSVGIASASSYFSSPENPNTTLLVFLASLGFVFQSANVIDAYFQSLVISKYSVIAQNAAFILTSLIKLYLLTTSASIEAFALVGSVEFAICSLFLAIVYHRGQGDFSGWSFKTKVAGSLIKDSWPLIITYCSYILYTRIDQVLIGQFMNDRSVGIYSAVCRIYELPMILASVFAQSINPRMIELYSFDRKKYFDRYLHFTALTSFAGYVFVFLTIFASDWIIGLLYGPAFSEGAEILRILIITQLFMFNAFFRSSHLTIENSQIYLLFSTLLAAISNLILNIIFIPKFGMKGAAITTVFSQIVSLFIFNIFFKKTREIFFLQLKAFLVYPLFNLIKRKPF